jgi:hypothetical protein
MKALTGWMSVDSVINSVESLILNQMILDLNSKQHTLGIAYIASCLMNNIVLTKTKILFLIQRTLLLIF